MFAAAKSELITVLDVLRFGMSQMNQAACFYGHGTDNAWDESLNIILHALNLDHGIHKDILHARLLGSEREAILALFQRRIDEKIPAAYLTNRSYFAGFEFFVDERVLVPRSPIGELIEARFHPWMHDEQVESILDLCTGSGCIAIASALHLPFAKVDAVDISEQALDVARINVEQHQLEQQVEVIQSDLFEALQGRRYDVIVTNPPYVDKADLDSMPEEFEHEPKLGLAAGDDGLEIVERLLKTATEHLTEHGILICEVGNSAYALEQRFPDVPFTWLEFERGGEGVFMLTAPECKTIAEQWS